MRMTIQPDDISYIKTLADLIAATSNKRIIQNMERSFVAEMTARYGRDTAAELLKKLWKRVEKIRERES